MRTKKWSGRLDSNQRPLRPERSAPTRLSYAPIFKTLINIPRFLFFSSRILIFFRKYPEIKSVSGSGRRISANSNGENGENGDRARYDLTGDRKFSRLGDFMPGVGFPRSPQDTRKTQDTPIPAVLGKTLTEYHFA